jgi:hypothetical protein
MNGIPGSAMPRVESSGLNGDGGRIPRLAIRTAASIEEYIQRPGDDNDPRSIGSMGSGARTQLVGEASFTGNRCVAGSGKEATPVALDWRSGVT